MGKILRDSRELKQLMNLTLLSTAAFWCHDAELPQSSRAVGAGSFCSVYNGISEPKTPEKSTLVVILDDGYNECYNAA